MQVRLYVTYRILAGTKGEIVDLPDGSTVRQVIAAFLAHYPALRPHWFDENGELLSRVKIFVDRRALETLEKGLETPLHADAVLDCFPPISGGCGVI